jgi:hypothetical protein
MFHHDADFTTALAEAVQRECQGVKVVVYLDDFLFIGNWEAINQALECFEAWCKTMCLPLNEKKAVSPRKRLTFLGIELDTVGMLAKLPLEKVERIRNEVQRMMKNRKPNLEQIQSLAGLLSWAAQAVAPARTFVRRVFDLGKGLKKAHHRRWMTAGALQDLRVWECFLREHNGISFFITERWAAGNRYSVRSDASGIVGFGFWCDEGWSWGFFPLSWECVPICVKELFAILAFFVTFGERLANSLIEFQCDNQAVCVMVNKQTSTNGHAMRLIRHMVLVSLERNCMFRAKFLPRNLNAPADALSKDDPDAFLKMCPVANLSDPLCLPIAIAPKNWLLY